MKSKKHEDSSKLEIARSERSETSIQRRGNSMKLPSHRSRIVIAGVTLAVTLGFTPVLHAQYGGSGGQQQQPPPPSLQQPNPPAKSGAQQAQQPPPQAPVDPEEEKAYKAFTDVKPEAFDQQIQVGEQYLQKYPTGHYAEQVYARLANAYFQKQQFDKMHAAGDKALALNPNDVSVLVLVGWVIPHNYDPNDPESDRRLAKAETYEKHALEILAAMPKPEAVTDEQFAKAKQASLAQAHSGLGLVYFRQQQFDKAVTEMQQAVKLDPTPDSVDLYILGVSLNQLKRYPEAADAFQQCAALPGAVQDRCKQREGEAKKLASAQPAPPK
jgi:tetratricopeptide (TPR) repeat protein